MGRGTSGGENQEQQGALFRGQLYLALKDVKETERSNVRQEFEQKLRFISTKDSDNFLRNMFR